MRTLRGLRATLALGFAGTVGLAGCEKELKLDPPASANDFVVAQFDPTNPIPVLQLVPAPTALAQRRDATGKTIGLNVAVQDCEKPSTKQCLGLVEGWPSTQKPRLFFSGELDLETVQAGVKLFRLNGAMMPPTPVAFTAEWKPRDAIPAACRAGGNGSNPPRAFDAGAIPPGKMLELTPSEPFQGSATYLVVVVSSDTVGLKGADGKRVEPSALFSLLNVAPEQAPIVLQDGKAVIRSALLRSNVQSSVLGSAFPGKSLAELTDADKATFATLLEATARERLLPLYQYFGALTGAAIAAGVAKREEIVLINSWDTAANPEGGEVVFDPTNQVVPFPNNELLTATTGPSLLDVRVNFGITPCGPGQTTGCDSPTAAGLKAGMNTLTGFSTTAPISVTVNAAVDQTTLAANVKLFRIDAQGALQGEIAIGVVATATDAQGRSSIVILPRTPLEQNALYAVVVRKGLKGIDGKDFRRSSTFNFMTIAEPLIGADGEINPAATVKLGSKEAALETVLQCSTVAATGQLASDETVLGTALTLERRLQRARWQTALRAAEAATPTIPRDEVLIAWTVKTQDITGTVDLVNGQLLPGPYQQARMTAGLPRLAGPLPLPGNRTIITATTTPNVEQLFQVVENFCVQLCEAGAAGIPTDQCQPTNPALVNAPLCRVASGLLTGRIGAVRIYAMTAYDLTAGNPNAGAGTFTPGRVVQPRLTQIPVWVVTPRGVAGAAPVGIFQHGLGRQKEDGFYFANTYAAAGWATVLMDLPFHGTRASDLVNNMTGIPCLANAPDPDTVQCAADGTCTNGCDGTRDGSGSGFLSANVFASRDNFRQATVDHLTLLRTLQAEGTANGLLSFLDGTRIGYAGQSLGAITGGNLAAYAPELSAAALNVGGGGLTNLLLTTVPQISAPLFAALAQAGVCELVRPGDPTSGCRPTPAFRQFLVLAQTALDPGDPLATSIGVLRAHNGAQPIGANKVLLQMAIPDPVVPNGTTRALANAYGFSLTDNSDTSRFQTYDFGTATPGSCHGFILAPLERCGGQDLPPGIGSVTAAICTTLGAQQQAVRFIGTGGTTIGSRIGTLPPGLPLACN
jgi:hypothetical protein